MTNETQSKSSEIGEDILRPFVGGAIALAIFFAGAYTERILSPPLEAKVDSNKGTLTIRYEHVSPTTLYKHGTNEIYRTSEAIAQETYSQTLNSLNERAK